MIARRPLGPDYLGFFLPILAMAAAIWYFVK